LPNILNYTQYVYRFSSAYPINPAIILRCPKRVLQKVRPAFWGRPKMVAIANSIYQLIVCAWTNLFTGFVRFVCSLNFNVSPVDTTNFNLSTLSLHFENKNYFYAIWWFLLYSTIYNSTWSDLIWLLYRNSNSLFATKTKQQFVMKIRTSGENDGIHIRGSECDQKILSKKESTGFVLSPNYPYPYIPKTVCRWVEQSK